MARKDNRTDAQVQGAITAASTLARTIGNNTMSTPQERHLRDELHNGINNDLTELETRSGN